MRVFFVCLGLCVMLVSAAFAAPYRTAHEGDRVGSLTVGLVKSQQTPVHVGCADGDFYGIDTFYFVPGADTSDLNNAVVETVEADGLTRIALVYDADTSIQAAEGVYVADEHGVIVYAAATFNITGICEALKR